MTTDLIQSTAPILTGAPEINLEDFALPNLAMSSVEKSQLEGGEIQTAAVETKTKVSNSPVECFFKCCLILVWSIMFNMISLFLPWIARAISYFNHRSFYNDIEKAQIQKLVEGLNVVIEGDRLGAVAQIREPGKIIISFTHEELKANIVEQGGDEKGAAALAKAVICLREKLYRLNQNGPTVLLKAQTIRDELSSIMQMPVFQQLASNQNCYAVNFLQILAVKWIATDANEALKAYGRKCLGEEQFDSQPGQTFAPQELADQLSGYLNRSSFNVDGWGPVKKGRFIWSAAHPRLAMNAVRSNTHPLDYNPKDNNPSFSGHRFEEEGRQAVFYYSPTPTGDPLFEFGLLPAYEKFGTFELRINHQDTSNRGDYPRIEDALRMAGDTHLHAVIGFDKKWEGEFNTPEEFFSSYDPYVTDGLREIRDRKTDNGLYIPKDMLDDSQVTFALARAEEFCQRLSVDNPYWKEAMKNKAGQKRMAKMMMLVADTFLTLGLTYGALDQITPQMIENTLNQKLDQDLMAIRASGAWKQNVDCAVIENISLRLFFRWATNLSPLTADEVCEIAGAVFGRARIIDNRNIQMRRYQILDDLLRFIGAYPGVGVEMAHTVLSEYRGAYSSLKSQNPGSFPTSTGWFSSVKKKVFG